MRHGRLTRLPIDMGLKVECYAGYAADERPVRFILGDRPYAVEVVLEQWREPDWAFFRVRADDGGVYLLRHDQRGDVWGLASDARQAGPPASD